MEFNIYSFDELTTQQLYDMMAHRFEVFVLGRGDITATSITLINKPST